MATAPRIQLLSISPREQEEEKDWSLRAQERAFLVCLGLSGPEENFKQ